MLTFIAAIREQLFSPEAACGDVALQHFLCIQCLHSATFWLPRSFLGILNKVNQVFLQKFHLTVANVWKGRALQQTLRGDWTNSHIQSRPVRLLHRLVTV